MVTVDADAVCTMIPSSLQIVYVVSPAVVPSAVEFAVAAMTLCVPAVEGGVPAAVT
jgi:hypothetical protein